MPSLDEQGRRTNAKPSRRSKARNVSKCMGHYCRICGRSRPNEQFSGRGHRIHVCKKCQRMPREKRERIERFDELHGFLQQSMISAKNVARLKRLARHEDDQVAELAALILEIARVFPGKRNRWLKLARHHRPLFNRTIELVGIEFLEDLLAGMATLNRPSGIFSNDAELRPRGLHVLAIAAAVVRFATAAWNEKTSSLTRKPELDHTLLDTVLFAIRNVIRAKRHGTVEGVESAKSTSYFFDGGPWSG